MQARMKGFIPEAIQALQSLGHIAEKGGVPAQTLALTHLRARQINGCSVCVDMALRFKKPEETIGNGINQDMRPGSILRRLRGYKNGHLWPSLQAHTWPLRDRRSGPRIVGIQEYVLGKVPLPDLPPCANLVQ
jgi:hypothetical protein